MISGHDTMDIKRQKVAREGAVRSVTGVTFLRHRYIPREEKKAAAGTFAGAFAHCRERNTRKSPAKQAGAGTGICRPDFYGEIMMLTGTRAVPFPSRAIILV